MKSKTIFLFLVIIVIIAISSCKQNSNQPTMEKLKAYWGDRLEIDIGSNNIDNMSIKLNGSLLDKESNLVLDKNSLFFGLNRPNNPDNLKVENILEVLKNNQIIKIFSLQVLGRTNSNEILSYFNCSGIKDAKQFNDLLKTKLKLQFNLLSFFKMDSLAVATKKEYCLANLRFNEGAVSTDKLIAQIKRSIGEIVPELMVERNYVFVNDQGSTPHLDPKCWQANELIAEAEGSTTLDIDKIDTFYKLPKGSGQGITIAVLDSGVSSAQLRSKGLINSKLSKSFISEEGLLDEVSCKDFENAANPGFLSGGHGQQVVALINSIANDAQITMLKVCNKNAECSSSNIASALLYLTELAQLGSRYDLINMSVGGETSSQIIENIMTNLFAFSPKTILVASAGNNPTDQNHYPASYANSLFNANVLAIAAAKQVSGQFEVAAINTGFSIQAEITSLMAPGINLTVGQSPPLIGTSFAAPIATGIIARKKQFNHNLIATDVHNQCLPSTSCLHRLIQ